MNPEADSQSAKIRLLLRRVRFSFFERQRSGLLKKLKDDNQTLASLTDSQRTLKALGYRHHSNEVVYCRYIREESIDILESISKHLSCLDPDLCQHEANLFLDALTTGMTWSVDSQALRALLISLHGTTNYGLTVNSMWHLSKTLSDNLACSSFCAWFRDLDPLILERSDPASLASINLPSKILVIRGLPMSGCEALEGDTLCNLFGYKRNRFQNQRTYRDDEQGRYEPVFFIEFEDASFATAAFFHLHGRFHGRCYMKRKVHLNFAQYPSEAHPSQVQQPLIHEVHEDGIRRELRTSRLSKSEEHQVVDSPRKYGESFKGTRVLRTLESQHMDFYSSQSSKASTLSIPSFRIQSSSDTSQYYALNLLTARKDPKSISLSGILSGKHNLSCFPQQRFFERDRARLAAMLASSVLFFHETPWLKDNWSSSDVLFELELGQSEDLGRSSLLQPYKRVTVPLPPPQQPYTTVPNPSTSLAVGQQQFGILNQILYHLGMVLLELIMDATLASLRVHENETEEQIAWRVEREVCGRAGPRWADIIFACLHCPFGQWQRKQPDLMDDDLCQAVMAHVISPLMEMTQLYGDD